MSEKRTRVLIRYDSKSTTNDEPIGAVYVESLSEFGEGIFSYTKDPDAATRFTEWDAEREISFRSWPNAQLVSVEEAKPLP